MTRIAGVARAAVLTAALAVPVGGCALFGSGDEDAPEATAPAPPAAPQQVLVDEVERLEIGRTRSGAMIAAFGFAAGPGHTRGTLVARNEGRPGPSGMIDFDFVATPPPVGVDLPSPSPRNRSIRADAEVSLNDVGTAQGVRVFGARSGAQLRF